MSDVFIPLTGINICQFVPVMSTFKAQTHTEMEQTNTYLYRYWNGLKVVPERNN